MKEQPLKPSNIQRSKSKATQTKSRQPFFEKKSSTPFFKAGATALQLKASAKGSKPSTQTRQNTSLPQGLKTGIESLSGYAMNDVKVYRNSDKPAKLRAHAFAQGTDIHLGPGQEKHLPHEAWHIVQQKQGRVKPTLQMKSGANINDEAALEQEADVMGAKAMQSYHNRNFSAQPSQPLKAGTQSATIQRADIDDDFEPGDKLYGLEKEGRATMLKLIEARQKTGDHPTIDSINNAFKLIGGAKNLVAWLEQAKDLKLNAKGQEIYDYGRFLLEARKDLKADGDMEDPFKNIRKSCKAALVFYSDKAAIRFELQGIKADKVVSDQGKDEPGITGTEMRAIMRQAMRDQGIIPQRVAEKKERGNINLANVHFYLNGERVQAPWLQPLESEWRKAWNDYVAKKTAKADDDSAKK